MADVFGYETRLFLIPGFFSALLIASRSIRDLARESTSIKYNYPGCVFDQETILIGSEPLLGTLVETVTDT